MSISRKKPTATRKPTTRKKKAVREGASRLCEAAEKTLAENSCEIAQSLYNSALKGNVSGARLLLELAQTPAEMEDEETVPLPRPPSTAKKLAAEPEWKDEDEGLGIRE
jgi:hypothetical protein